MSDARTDEALIAALRAGEVSAFDQLYPRYERRLYGYIRRLMGDPAVAEDLFQDIFLSVLKDRTFDPTRGSFSAWLFRVARNRCLMERRTFARRSCSDAELTARPVAQSETPDPERNHRVRAAIDRLDDGQRQILLLKQVAELTYREIGELLEIKEGTVKSRLHAAMKAFRHQLELLGEPI